MSNNASLTMLQRNPFYLELTDITNPWRVEADWPLLLFVGSYIVLKFPTVDDSVASAGAALFVLKQTIFWAEILFAVQQTISLCGTRRSRLVSKHLSPQGMAEGEKRRWTRKGE
jgi:hypothetical protein